MFFWQHLSVTMRIHKNSTLVPLLAIQKQIEVTLICHYKSGGGEELPFYLRIFCRMDN